MGLTLMRAISMGVPTIASDLPAVRELSISTQGLVAAGDADAWAQSIGDFLKNGTAAARFDKSKIPSTADMAHNMEGLYKKVLHISARSVQ